jgi:hypothetical protein
MIGGGSRSGLNSQPFMNAPNPIQPAAAICRKGNRRLPKGEAGVGAAVVAEDMGFLIGSRAV